MAYSTERFHMADALLLVGSTRLTRLPNLQSLQWRTNTPLSSLSHPSFLTALSIRSVKPIKCSPKCCANTLQRKAKSELPTRNKDPNPVRVVLDTVLSAIKALKTPAIAMVLMGLLFMSDPNSAWAASGGRMGGTAFSARSSSSSAPSRSYSMGSASSPFSYSAPYYAPTLFGGGGFFVAPAVGVGVGAGSSFLLILMGFAAFVLVSGFLSDRSGEGSVFTATEKTSVLKLQVGLLGSARSLQKDLDQIARAADTSTPVGLNYVLTETVLTLLRHPDFCISAYSSVDVKRSIEDGEKRFNQLSIEERGKFDEETLVNVNSIRRQSTARQRASGFSNEYIVTTILVAAEGVYKLPSINGSKDLKEALQRLGSIPSNRTMAVEVLWTPQDENDTLTERELLEDYSLLRPL